MKVHLFNIALLLLFGGFHSPVTKKRPPNIVVIFTDDQGWGDVGCYGAEGFATPNLDSMAGEGVRLTHFYTAQPVCSAARGTRSGSG